MSRQALLGCTTPIGASCLWVVQPLIRTVRQFQLVGICFCMSGSVHISIGKDLISYDALGKDQGASALLTSQAAAPLEHEKEKKYRQGWQGVTEDENDGDTAPRLAIPAATRPPQKYKRQKDKMMKDMWKQGGHDVTGNEDDDKESNDKQSTDSDAEDNKRLRQFDGMTIEQLQPILRYEDSLAANANTTLPPDPERACLPYGTKTARDSDR